jgi:hypothetical protein
LVDAAGGAVGGGVVDGDGGLSGGVEGDGQVDVAVGCAHDQVGGADRPGAGTGLVPLAPMVMTPVSSATVALVGLLRVTVKLRAGTGPARLRRGTVMFWAASPGGKVRVPLVVV